MEVIIPLRLLTIFSLVRDDLNRPTFRFKMVFVIISFAFDANIMPNTAWQESPPNNNNVNQLRTMLGRKFCILGLENIVLYFIAMSNATIICHGTI